ncbi:MAG: OmpA family protein, partial [Pseudomonadota bacterium]
SDSLGRRLPMRDINVALIDDRSGNWPRIAEDALDALGKLATGELQISGTTVRLTGEAASRRAKEEADALIAGLVDVAQPTSDIALQDDGQPFTLNIDYIRDGETTASGKLPFGAGSLVPDALDVGTLENNITIGLLDDPREQWPDLAERGLSGLSELENGTLEVRTGLVRLAGTAGTRAAKSTAEGRMTDLREAYPGVSVFTQIDLVDDGAPFSFTVKYAEGAPAIASGKLPDGADLELLERNLGTGLNDDVLVALLDDPDGQFLEMAEGAAAALGRLDTGVLELTETTLRLTGIAGSRDAKAEADALIAALPDGFEVTADVRLADDGRPFSLDADVAEEATTVRGKLPFGMPDTLVPDTLGDGAEAGDLRISLLDDTEGGWAEAATQSLIALGLLEQGTLSIAERTVTLTGLARTPTELAAAEEVLAAIPESFEQDIDLSALDDGQPLAFDITYDAATGATVVGKLPDGLTLEDVADVLDLRAVDGTPSTGVDGDAETTLADIATFASWLSELEAGTFSLRDGVISVTGIATIGLDSVVLAERITAGLSEGAVVTIEPLAELPAESAARVNAATREREIFRGGHWLPQGRAFAPLLDVCEQKTDDILSENKITFLTSSADLDPRSVRSINSIAAVMLRCLDGSQLQVELGGHTDSRGPTESNLELSQARADAVRDALTARGIPEDKITAVGYGESQPIADNETEEGQAANRRTSISWSN